MPENSDLCDNLKLASTIMCIIIFHLQIHCLCFQSVWFTNFHARPCARHQDTGTNRILSLPLSQFPSSLTDLGPDATLWATRCPQPLPSSGVLGL